MKTALKPFGLSELIISIAPIAYPCFAAMVRTRPRGAGEPRRLGR